MTTVFMTNQVESAAGDFAIEDFDTYGEGVYTGTNTFLEWSSVQKNNAVVRTSATKTASAPLSLRVRKLAPSGTDNSDEVTFNLTHSVDITRGTFSYYTDYVGGTYWVVTDIISFKNDIGTEIIKFKIDMNTVGANGIWVYDYDAYYNLGGENALRQKWNTVGFQLNHTSGQPANYIYYFVLNSSGGVVYSAEKRWMGLTELTEFSLNQIYADFNGAVHSSTALYNYYDDFIVNTQTMSGGGYGDFGGITPICSGGLGTYAMMSYTETIGGIVIPWYPSPIIIGGSSTMYPSKYIEHEFPYTWSGTIYGVDLPVDINQLTYVSNDTNDYWLTVNGIPSFGHPDYILPTTDGEYVLRWISETGITLTNEKPLFAFYCDEHTAGFAKDWYWYGVGISYNAIGDSLTHNDDIWYFDNFFNGYVPDTGDISMCYYVITDTTKQGEDGLSDIELVNYTGLYGYMFIEFYENTFSCYHGIGSNPHIMYYLNDTYLEADSPFYRYQIMQVGTNIAVYDGLISMTGTHKDAKLRIMDYKFTQKGQYYIVLYNTTDYGTVLGSELYYSQVITVCDVGLGDPVTDTVTGGMIGLDFSGIPIFFKVIIALLIIVVLTISPYFLVVMIGRGADNHIELPALVYVAFFFIGVVASVMLGFLDAWVFFVIFFGLILTLAIFWVRGKSGEGGE
jgi:hypothetical protein